MDWKEKLNKHKKYSNVVLSECVKVSKALCQIM